MERLFFKNQKGSALITTTLVIASISVMVLVSLGISSRSLISASKNYSDSAYVFYAVEGSLQETLQHTATDPTWPTDANYSDTYIFENVNITRTITTTAENKVYEISGEYNGVNRKIVATDDLLGNVEIGEVAP